MIIENTQENQEASESKSRKLLSPINPEYKIAVNSDMESQGTSGDKIKSSKSSKLEINSPEVQKVIKAIPEDIGIGSAENTDFIVDEEEKIKDLVANNKTTIYEYNKLMKYKHKSQLNITDMSNVSDFNLSAQKVNDENPVEQSVLFGKDFANSKARDSEFSMLKVRKASSEDHRSSFKPSDSDGTPSGNQDFSMSKQVEEFKRQLVLDKVQSQNFDDRVDKDLIMTSPIKRDFRESEISNFNLPSARYAESVYDDDVGRNTIRNTEINSEWENMVRESNYDNKKNIADDITDRETQFFEFIHSKKAQIRESTSKTYLRNQKGEVANRHIEAGPNPLMSTNLFNQSMLTTDPSISEEKEQVKPILKIELIIIMLQRKNMHK